MIHPVKMKQQNIAIILCILLNSASFIKAKCHERYLKHNIIMNCNSVQDVYSTRNHENVITLLIRNFKSSVELRNDSFYQMKNLRMLYINGYINKIERYAFRGLENLNELSLRNTKFEELSNKIFIKVPVYRLEVAFSSVKKLQIGVFDAMPNLRILGLMTNKITTIPLGVFNNLNVEEIDLSENLISKIEEGAFFGTDKLKRLNLRSNKLIEFDPLKILGRSSISLLNLDNNAIVDDDIFVPHVKEIIYVVSD